MGEAMIHLRKAAERGHFDPGWLRALSRQPKSEVFVLYVKDQW
jgi:hypothetical protein